VQAAAVFLPGDKYPTQIEVGSPDSGTYAVGDYQLSAESIYVRDGKLAIWAKLVPLKKAAA
jgi:hypothetical protein